MRSNWTCQKSRKYTIQSWIFILQKRSMIFIHNAVTKMHKCNWGHNLNHGNLKSSHRWQNRCQFGQHISSHVKFGITYYHYYHICFYTPQCNHRYNLIAYVWGKNPSIYVLRHMLLLSKIPIMRAVEISFDNLNPCRVESVFENIKSQLLFCHFQNSDSNVFEVFLEEGVDCFVDLIPCATKASPVLVLCS